MPGLQKAEIRPEGRPPIKVLFNPAQYGLDKGVQLAEQAVRGRDDPIIQFVRGTARTLSMELFFDTYEAKTDVREATDTVYNLTAVEPSKHVPPICVFVWGKFNFRGVVERVSGRFTLFFPDGTPARATLTVAFKEILKEQQELQRSPNESSDHAKTRLLRPGDTLSSMAAAEYDDPAKWRLVAEANGIDNPRRVPTGQFLKLPPSP